MFAANGQFCIGAFGRNMASVALKLFTRLIYVISKCYRYTLNALCKVKAAVNCMTLQQGQICLIPVNFEQYCSAAS
jgi:hypothetical protein